MAKEYPCKQCTEIFDSPAGRYHHGKRVHGVKVVPSMVDVGMKEAPLNLEKGNDEAPLPKQLQDLVNTVFSGWLDKLDIHQVWDNSCSGYRIDIHVPRDMSTYWRQSTKYKFDSDERAKILGSEKIDVPDVRSHVLSGHTSDDIKRWFLLVKQNILENAQKHGLVLPSTQATYQGSNSVVRSGPANTFFSKEEYPTVA